MKNMFAKLFLPLPLRAFLCGGFLLSATLGEAAEPGAYRLDTMDKVRVRVAEWQSAEGAVRDWGSISGDYRIGPSGDISLPFIGELPVRGKTTGEIAAAVADGLQQKLGLPDRPEASVEIAEFRPVFIAGDVQTPGRYPYDPELTVLKAISLAGGMRRADSAGQGASRDFIMAHGNREVLVAERNGLLARRARLIAEAEGKDQIEFPEELSKSEAGRKLINDETALMTARQKRLGLQLANLDDLRKLLEAEVESLQQKIATQNRQLELSRTELKGLGDLVQKGLVVNQRVLSLEQNIADLEGKGLDMETAILRAKQDIAKASQDAIILQNDRDTEIAQARQDTEAQLEALDLKLGMYAGLMMDALERAPDAARDAAPTPEPVFHYSIVRVSNGQTTELAADENTPVLPGDVVKAEVDRQQVTSN